MYYVYRVTTLPTYILYKYTLCVNSISENIGTQFMYNITRSYIILYLRGWEDFKGGDKVRLYSIWPINHFFVIYHFIIYCFTNLYPCRLHHWIIIQYKYYNNIELHSKVIINALISNLQWYNERLFLYVYILLKLYFPDLCPLILHWVWLRCSYHLYTCQGWSTQSY